MTEQYNDSIRCEILAAFTAERRANRSLVPDNLAEGGMSKPIKVVDAAGLVTGQREITYAVATRAKGTSSCPLHDDAFAHARVVRAVNQLPGHHKAIVMLCYVRDCSDWDSVTAVTQYAWSHMELFIAGWERLHETQLKASKVQKLRALTFNALLHFREGAANRRKLYTIQILAGLLMVSESNWRRDWGPFWNQLLTILAHLDSQALQLVGQASRDRSAA